MSAPAVRHPGEFRWETRLLAVATLVLTAIGVASCYASGTYITGWFLQASQQAIAALIGGVLFLIVANVDYQVWRKLALPLFLVTLAGLVLIAMVAVLRYHRSAPGLLGKIFPQVNGAHRWIWIGVSIQVSEIARFTLAAWLAAYATDLGAKVRSFNQGFLPLAGTIGLVALLVAIEPSLSMAVTLTVIGFTVIFAAGARITHLALVTVIAVAGVMLVLRFDPVRSGREKTFQQASLECTDDQACQSLIGLGNGGVVGVGFGRGTQKLGQLREASSDFLLSVIGEEWGFAGVTFVAFWYTVFCWMGFRIARTARDPFATYLAAGLTTAVGLTAFLHAATVTRLMPTTGLTLPFMSVGRVSLLLYLFSAGVLVSIGRRRGRPAR